MIPTIYIIIAVVSILLIILVILFYKRANDQDKNHSKHTAPPNKSKTEDQIKADLLYENCAYNTVWSDYCKENVLEIPLKEKYPELTTGQILDVINKITNNYTPEGVIQNGTNELIDHIDNLVNETKGGVIPETTSKTFYTSTPNYPTSIPTSNPTFTTSIPTLTTAIPTLTYQNETGFPVPQILETRNPIPQLFETTSVPSFINSDPEYGITGQPTLI